MDVHLELDKVRFSKRENFIFAYGMMLGIMLTTLALITLFAW